MKPHAGHTTTDWRELQLRTTSDIQAVEKRAVDSAAALDDEAAFPTLSPSPTTLAVWSSSLTLRCEDDPLSSSKRVVYGVKVRLTP